MSVKIRLKRMGAKKNPFYRVVVADSRFPRDGRLIAEIGTYNPQTDPSTVKIDVAAAKEWISKGAQPTETVRKLLKIAEAQGSEEAVEPKKAVKKETETTAVKKEAETAAVKEETVEAESAVEEVIVTEENTEEPADEGAEA